MLNKDIDWDQTCHEYGYRKIPNVQSKVIVRCPECGTIRPYIYKNFKARLKRGPYKCHSCTIKQASYIEKRAKLLKKLNNDPEIARKQKKACELLWTKERKRKQSKISKNNWISEDYKNAQKVGLKKKWVDPSYRSKQSENTKKLWHNKRSELIAAIKKGLAKPEVKEKMAIIRSSQLNKSVSGPHKVICDILDTLDISHKNNYPLGPWTFDIFIEKYSLFIEVQGNYWHSLPKAVSNDKAKKTYIEKYHPSLTLKYIWEHQVPSPSLAQTIKRWCGIKTEIVNFSFKDLTVECIAHNEAKVVLQNFHYLGNIGKKGLYIGAVLQGKIVAVICFTPPTRTESATRLGLQPKQITELSRFCIHPLYQKKNLASWFISKAIKTMVKKWAHKRMIITFADETYGHSGIIYKAAGFSYDGKLRPDYWYAKEDGWVMHKKTLYNHAVKMGRTEKEYAKELGYRKVFGMSKHRYLLKL